MVCSIEVENVFGPTVAATCRDGFDFTLLFEELILTIGPIAVASLLIAFRLYQLFHSSPKVQISKIYYLKLIAHAAFALIQITTLILLIIPDLVPKTRASVATAAISSVASILFILLSHLEHTRSARPSAVLSLYFGASVILDTIRLRTLWIIPRHVLIAIISSVSVGLRLLLFILESLEKVSRFRQGYENLSLESVANIFNRNFFWWLNPFLWRGYGHVIELETLPYIDDRLNSPKLQSILFARWSAIKPKSSGAFVRLLFLHHKWPLAAAVLPRLCLTGFTFAQPFLITRVVEFAMQPKVNLEGEISSGLIMATAIVYVGLAITTANHEHKTYRAITMLRGSLVSLIYQGTLGMNTAVAGDSAALTLMSTDVERAGTGLHLVHELWASPIDLGLGFWLLARQLGPAAAAPGVIFALCSVAGVKVAGSMGARQRLWLNTIQKRVKVTSDMLGAMKEVRMAGLQAKMKLELQRLRSEEIESSRAFKNALALIVTVSYTTTSMAPVFAFGIFELLARKNHTVPLNTTKAFTSLAIFAILRTPMSIIIDAIAGVVNAVGSLARIGEFLSTEDKIDSKDDPETQTLAMPDDQQRKTSFEKGEGIGPTDIEMSRVAMPESHGDDMIVGKSVSAGWDKKKPFAIKDLEFRIPRSALTFVIGPVGSGKSTFLYAILGETIRNSGSIRVGFSHAAFCSQVPWITNETIRQNILGANLYDQPWYEQVLDACVLTDDLKGLPKGDQENVGGGGSNLSGGQQARLAIARAVYSKKKMIFLDDVMSGLDARTESTIFNNLLGENGLLRVSGITVIYATNGLSRLSSAQHIIVLSSSGRIVEQGTYEELSSTIEHAQAAPPEYSEVEETIKESMDAHSTKLLRVMTHGASTGVDRRTGDTAVYMYYIKIVGILNSILFLIFCGSFVFALTFPQYVVKWWAEENDVHPHKHLWAYLGGYAGLGALAIVSLALGAWHLVAHMMPRASTAFHDALLDTTTNAPLSLFSETDIGITVNRFSQDLQLIDMELPLALFNTSIEVISCFAQLLMVAISAKYIGAALPAVLVVFYVIQKFYLRCARQLRLLDIEAKGPLFSKFLEALAGLVTIRAFGWEAEFERRNQETLDISQRPFYLLYCSQRWLNLVLDFVVTGIAVLVVAVGVETKGKLSPGLVGVALVNILNFSVSIKAALQNWTQLETSIGAVSRVKSFAAETKSEHRPQETMQPPPDWPALGAVSFQGVTATWAGKSKPVMKTLNLPIEPGQKIAICGRSGSGKSSIISSLLRLLEPSEGTTLIDNIDIATLPRAELRSRLICVTQAPYLIAGTVRENINPFGTADDKEVMMALEGVQLLDLVEELGGLDAILAADTMSVGQKQLICMARAMLRRGSILILDEATASLDYDTDEIVQRVIRTHFKSHTVITVAHRLNTILDYDRIAMISDGEMVEFDKPSILLKREPPSRFAELYRISGGAAQLAQEKGKEPSRGLSQRQRSQQVHRSQTFDVYPTEDTVPDSPFHVIPEEEDNYGYEGHEEDNDERPLIERNDIVVPVQSLEAGPSVQRNPTTSRMRVDETFQLLSRYNRFGSIRGRYEPVETVGTTAPDRYPSLRVRQIATDRFPSLRKPPRKLGSGS